MACVDSQLLSAAAKSNDLEAAELLLKEKGLDIYSKDEKGMTLLHILVQKRIEMLDSLRNNCKEESLNNDISKNEKFIDVLLKHTSADPNITDDTRLLNFYAACTLENCSVAESLLLKISDINQCISESSSIWPGYTALHFAAHCNDEIVKMLIAKGANLLTCDAVGLSSLDICIKFFDLKKVQSILTSVTAWKDILFSDGKTKLMDYVSSLCDSDSHNKFLASLDSNIEISLPEDSPLWPGCTILHLAVILLADKKDQIITEILNRNTDVTIQDSYGFTPIHLAFRKEKFQILHLLINHRSKIVNPLDNQNLSHLHIACALRHFSFVEQLLTIESNLDIAYNGKPLAKVKPGWTPLNAACFINDTTVVRMLLNAGANPLQADAEGFTAIHRLFNTDEKTNVIFDVLTATEEFKDCVVEGLGLTHLHVMVFRKKPRLVERLLNLGADIEATIGENEDEYLKKFVGYTPLHLAMINVDSDTIKVLLGRGANMLVKKPDGSFPLLEALIGGGVYPKESLLPNLFAPVLWANPKLQKQIKEKLGLTMLHIACRSLDLEKVANLLHCMSTVDVNARINEDSPIWPGFTPLHVLISFSVGRERYNDIQEKINSILDFLLDHKQLDVTVTDVNGDTPLHLTLKYRYDSHDVDIERIRAELLIKRHRNFNINPVNKEGVSHFHIACMVCDPKAVKGFLECGVNVNQSVNESGSKVAGEFPLHLALNLRTKKLFLRPQLQIETVGLLIKHGANVNAVNSRGWTPLHCVAKCGPDRLKLLRLIVRNDTDMNKEAVDGRTPFEVLLHYVASIPEIEYFIKHGSRVHTYNRISNQGYMGLVRSNSKYKKVAKDILKLMVCQTPVGEIDERGRNAIFNTIWDGNCKAELIEADFTPLIEKLIKLGCDIHQQDHQGKTPLHAAVESRDSGAVLALLICGADINLVDFSGHSPFYYCINPTKKKDFFHSSTLTTYLIDHLKRLKLIGLEVSPQNMKLLNDTWMSMMSKSYDTYLIDQINKIKRVKIGTRGLTLYDYVFEKDVVKIISKFTLAERNTVGKFLKSIDYSKYGCSRYFLKLQYRKVKERLSLMEPATKSLIKLLDFPLPAVCVDIVLKCLRNEELKNLVKSTTE